jgi:hypothetical protein
VPKTKRMHDSVDSFVVSRRNAFFLKQFFFFFLSTVILWRFVFLCTIWGFWFGLVGGLFPIEVLGVFRRCFFFKEKMLFFVVATIVGVAVAFVFFARRRYIAGAKQSSAELIVLQLLCWCPRLRGQSKLLDGQSFVSSRGVDCLGLLLGSAIGDALGAGVEMVSARNMAKVPDLFQDYVNLRTGKFGINYQSGMVTDDTEHTIANALAMCDPGPVTVHKLLRYYKEEYERSRNWLGIGRQGHGSILEYLEAGSEEEAERAIQRVRKRQSEKDRPGNGPVMRAAVLGLIDRQLNVVFSLLLTFFFVARAWRKCVVLMLT